MRYFVLLLAFFSGFCAQAQTFLGQLYRHQEIIRHTLEELPELSPVWEENLLKFKEAMTVSIDQLDRAINEDRDSMATKRLAGNFVFGTELCLMALWQMQVDPQLEASSLASFQKGLDLLHNQPGSRRSIGISNYIRNLIPASNSIASSAFSIIGSFVKTVLSAVTSGIDPIDVLNNLPAEPFGEPRFLESTPETEPAPAGITVLFATHEYVIFDSKIALKKLQEMGYESVYLVMNGNAVPLSQTFLLNSERTISTTNVNWIHEASRKLAQDPAEKKALLVLPEGAHLVRFSDAPMPAFKGGFLLAKFLARNNTVHTFFQIVRRYAHSEYTALEQLPSQDSTWVERTRKKFEILANSMRARFVPDLTDPDIQPNSQFPSMIERELPPEFNCTLLLLDVF